ncbi:MAG: TonB-dependent receptor [Gammaproteobacteria bacterium]|nr:TonB-dependent receptor [Gammaproteobacteria bacterium]
MRFHARALALFAVSLSAHAAQGRDKVEQIIVTALPLTQRLEDVAQPTQVLGGDELRAGIEASIGETLAQLPGTSSSYFGPAASRPLIRGLGGERLQVLEDGLGSLDASALSPDHAVTVEPLLAEQVEVLRGPATLLYGNGTVGGVVNVVTSRIPAYARDEQLGGAAEVRGNTALHEAAATGRLDATLGRFGLHLDGYRRETDDVRIDGIAWSRGIRELFADEGLPVDETSGRVPNSDSESNGGGAGASWLLDEGFVGVGFSTFDTNYGLPGPAEEPGEPGVRIDMEQDRYDFAGELAGVLPGFNTLRFRAAVNDYTHSEIEGDGAVGTVFDQDAIELRASADHNEIAGWRGALGLQYRDTELEAVGEEAFLPPSETRNLGLFLFEERPAGSLTWQAGLRVEHQEIDAESEAGSAGYDDTSVNLSGGLVWDFAKDWSLALNLSHAERHPSATELYADGPHLAVRRFEIGDPDLESETALSADLTLRATAGDIGLSLTVFANSFSDFIFPAATGDIEDDLPVVEYRQQDARFLGFEAELGLPIAELADGTLSARLIADYVRGRLDNGGGNVPQLPPLRVGGELAYDRDRFSASLAATRYADQDHVADSELPTDGYTQLDIDLSYRFPVGDDRLLAYLRGTNLLDEEARRASSSLKEFAPLPGIGVTAGLRFEF